MVFIFDPDLAIIREHCTVMILSFLSVFFFFFFLSFFGFQEFSQEMEEDPEEKRLIWRFRMSWLPSYREYLLFLPN